MRVNIAQRKSMIVEQMPMEKVSVYKDESILEANKIFIRQKINLVPVVERENPTKVVGAVTTEAIASAYDKARNR